METKTLYTLKRNSIWLPRRNHGKDYKAYTPLISLEAQDDCEPVELQRSESLTELQAVLNSDACRPYIDNKKSPRANAPGLFYILQMRAGYVFLKSKSFAGIITRAAMIRARGGPFPCV